MKIFIINLISCNIIIDIVIECNDNMEINISKWVYIISDVDVSK